MNTYMKNEMNPSNLRERKFMNKLLEDENKKWTLLDHDGNL